MNFHGIKEEDLIEFQNLYCIELDQVIKNKNSASTILRQSINDNDNNNPFVEMFIKILQNTKYDNSVLKEPFLYTLLKSIKQFHYNNVIKKARIKVPDTFLLLGVLDETGFLKENEIFVQTSEFIYHNGSVDKKDKIWEGDVLVARNPALHPGDLQVVKAVDCLKLHHLWNVILFSSVGKRPLPSMLSGGDLGILIFIQ